MDIHKELKDLRERVEALEAVMNAVHKSRRFIPPKIQEVQEYCTLRNNGIDPEYFISSYKSKGWKVGSTKMKDWKAAVRTWEKRSEKGSGFSGSSGDEGAERVMQSCRARYKESSQ